MSLPRPLEQMKSEARRDHWHLAFVGSDIRQLIGEIESLRETVSALPVCWTLVDGKLEQTRPVVPGIIIISIDPEWMPDDEPVELIVVGLHHYSNGIFALVRSPHDSGEPIDTSMCADSPEAAEALRAMNEKGA